MEIESTKCECYGLKEDFNQDYIGEGKSNFDGQWLCGLCSQVVRHEHRKKSVCSGRSNESSHVVLS